jgi:hypothetical protein
VPKLGTKVVSWLDVQKDDVILDLGCGGEFSSFSHFVENVVQSSFISICKFVPCLVKEIPTPRVDLRLLIHLLLSEILVPIISPSKFLYFICYLCQWNIVFFSLSFSFKFCQDAYFHLDNLQILQPQMEYSISSSPKLFRKEPVRSTESTARKL